MKDIPIYDKTVSYAIEHNELEAYFCILGVFVISLFVGIDISIV